MTHMYDSAAGRFPDWATCVALYSNGAFRYTGTRAPHWTHVLWIDVLATNPTGASILDVEQGDATPDHVAAWCRARLDAVPDSLLRLYCNESTWPAVIRAVRTLPMDARRRVRYWIATDTGTEPAAGEWPVGASAVQWRFGPDGGWDTSTIAEDW